MATLYQQLGLTRDASTVDIEAAFREKLADTKSLPAADPEALFVLADPNKQPSLLAKEGAVVEKYFVAHRPKLPRLGSDGFYLQRRHASLNRLLAVAQRKHGLGPRLQVQFTHLCQSAHQVMHTGRRRNFNGLLLL